MAKITKYLSEWESAGLLESLQVQKILEYEKNRDKKPWVLYSFIMLGVSIISIGIVSLIAANWSDIPPAVKIAGDLTIMAAIAWGIYRASVAERPLLFDALSALFIFFYLASIGLLSQIYHTGGELYEALFILCAVMFPLTLLSYRRFIPNAWTYIFVQALFLFCLHRMDFFHESDSYFVAAGILASFPFICAIPGNLFSMRDGFNKVSGPFILWAVISFFGGVFFFDLRNSMQSSNYYSTTFSFFSDDVSLTAYSLIIAVSGMAAIVSLLFNRELTGRVKFLSSVLASVYGISMIFFAWYDRYYYLLYKAQDFDPETRVQFYSVLKASGPVETIFALLLISFIFLSLNMEKLFNFMVMLIGVRFLIVYFQVFGSLAYTGVGLIISGLIIIGFVAAWYRYGKKIGGFLK
ncbi:MAG TPA: DUF2157 domain-containing protein [Spirochaetota bacterium]|nr:DUF2157 domain-containing protein [Spirochaetota bacterium]